MLGFKGPAQPSPTLGDALNAGYGYLEVRCLRCDTNQTVALDIVRRPKCTPVHELDVSFQEVVHPVLNGEAEVVEALANPGRTEWTLMRMPL
jgi:hypothetical protein